MKHEISTALYEYWLSCRHETGVRANGIRAAELAPILPSLFLIDIDFSEDPEFHFRFCGASIASRYGRDLAEESFLSLWSPDDRHSLKRDLRANSFPSTGLVAGVMCETMGSGFISFEMMLLPLAGENGTAGAIGSMVRIGGHEESNRIRARIVAQSLRSVRFLPTVLRRDANFAPASAPLVPDPSYANLRRYRHLTVVSGGK
jgi:hypothetical protein